MFRCTLGAFAGIAECRLYLFGQAVEGVEAAAMPASALETLDTVVFVLVVADIMLESIISRPPIGDKFLHGYNGSISPKVGHRQSHYS